MFLYNLITNNVTHEIVNDLTLYIISDFQFDINVGRLNITTLYENIVLLFNEAGLKTCWKIPYKPPNIVFWNLKSTNGFPCKTHSKKCIMKSGFSFW